MVESLVRSNPTLQPHAVSVVENRVEVETLYPTRKHAD